MVFVFPTTDFASRLAPQEEQMKKIIALSLGLAVFSATNAFADSANCNGLPNEDDLQKAMREAAASHTAGGLFNGKRMWGAVVNRDGEICAYVTTTNNATQVWPGSQAIAKAKAYTANAFSLDTPGPSALPPGFPLSTARLYTFTQPGHSLWSLGQSNLWNPDFNAAPGGQGGGTHRIGGGLIFFGGGVALYRNGRVIGGLGISGDTSCADHEIAKFTRDELGLNPPGGPTADDISYSSTDGPSVFTHPLCLNTWRNDVFVGNEAPAAGY
jgi:uncharacterized protein GlcG (DUF336 family)